MVGTKKGELIQDVYFLEEEPCGDDILASTSITKESGLASLHSM